MTKRKHGRSRWGTTCSNSLQIKKAQEKESGAVQCICSLFYLWSRKNNMKPFISNTTVSDKNSRDTNLDQTLVFSFSCPPCPSQSCLSRFSHRTLYTNIEGTRRHKSVPTILTETVVLYNCYVLYLKSLGNNHHKSPYKDLNTEHIIKESVFTGHRIFVQIIIIWIMLIIIIIRMVGITFMAHQ